MIYNPLGYTDAEAGFDPDEIGTMEINPTLTGEGFSLGVAANSPTVDKGSAADANRPKLDFWGKVRDNNPDPGPFEVNGTDPSGDECDEFNVTSF